MNLALLAVALDVKAEHRPRAARQQLLRQRMAGVVSSSGWPTRDTNGWLARNSTTRWVLPCAAPCAAAGFRCPAKSARRCAGSCRRQSRAGLRAARAAEGAHRGFLGEHHVVKAVVGCRSARGTWPLRDRGSQSKLPPSTTTPAHHRAVAAQELGGRVVDQIGAQRSGFISQGEVSVESTSSGTPASCAMARRWECPARPAPGCPRFRQTAAWCWAGWLRASRRCRRA
jgi:hypothetical protein